MCCVDIAEAIPRALRLRYDARPGLNVYTMAWRNVLGLDRRGRGAHLSIWSARWTAPRAGRSALTGAIWVVLGVGSGGICVEIGSDSSSTYNLVPVLTAYENAETVLALQGIPLARRRQQVMRLLDEVGLEGLRTAGPISCPAGSSSE